jgi:serine/threonine-protein kinase RsbW
MYKYYTDTAFNYKNKITILNTQEIDKLSNKKETYLPKSVFFFKNEQNIESFKFHYGLNKSPVIYIGNSKQETGVMADFLFKDVEGNIEEKLKQFFKKNRGIEIKSIIKNTFKEVNRAIDNTYSFLKMLNSKEDILFLKLAIDEALINAYLHGNKKDPLKKIQFGLKYNNDKLEIFIEDEGKGYNIQEICDKESDIFAPSGRGIKLIKELMDEVVFKYRGKKINMVKYIH